MAKNGVPNCLLNVPNVFTELLTPCLFKTKPGCSLQVITIRLHKIYSNFYVFIQPSVVLLLKMWRIKLHLKKIHIFVIIQDRSEIFFFPSELLDSIEPKSYVMFNIVLEIILFVWPDACAILVWPCTLLDYILSVLSNDKTVIYYKHKHIIFSFMLLQMFHFPLTLWHRYWTKMSSV